MTSEQSGETWHKVKLDGRSDYKINDQHENLIAMFVREHAADRIIADHELAEKCRREHEQKVGQLEERLAAGEQAIEELRAALAAYRASHQPATEAQG